ncbi:hypothetical protein QO010_000470 [Caulobacter ginsengisoli]|uniref:Uncharacterized protein n=1 Tax=Caulobacter ginsengisoli TaxID=400775 RepID=A0ABU0IP24_9CAUL|nr:hypothetical protein [Caulobacter ginsengisoli]MDQ0462722.1 hypothetical protein [Caulobacter ginsengisoli]
MADPSKPTPTPGQIAERLQRRRIRIIWAQAILFLIMQTTYYTNMPSFDAPLRLVDQVKLSAFAVWAVALMVLLAVSGGVFRSKAVRALMDDELTRAHRASALALGYYAAMLAAIVLYVVSQYVRMSAPEAIHLIVSAGVLAPMLRFVFLERRAERS